MGESVLDRWQRLEACMDAVRATKALREAVRALGVIADCDDESGRMARAAILRVEKELRAEVDLDA